MRNEERFKYVADALSNEQGVLFILHGGDYANNDNASEWTDFFGYGDGMLANYSIFTNIGNHEYHNGTGDNASTDAYEYRHAFDYPLYYSFDCAGIRFVVLDSPDPNSTDDQNPTLAHSEAQASWLKDQLDNDYVRDLCHRSSSHLDLWSCLSGIGPPALGDPVSKNTPSVQISQAISTVTSGSP